MNQAEIDKLAESFRAQGLTWAQTNFAVAVVRNAVNAAAPAAPAEVSGHAEFALQALVAAGHISQATVDGALQIAKRVVPAPAAPAPHPDTQDAERLRYLLSDDGDWTLCEWDHDAGYWVSDQREPDVVRAAIDAAIAASKGGAA